MEYRTRPIRPPYKRTYMRFVGSPVLAYPQKSPSRKGYSAPRCRAKQPDPAPPLRYLAGLPAFGNTRLIVLLRAGYQTRVPSRGPGESIKRSWRPRAKIHVAKGHRHNALGWRHGVGLLEKYSRPEASLFFGADIGGRSPQREIAFGDTRHESPQKSRATDRRPKSRLRTIFARHKSNTGTSQQRVR